MTSKEPVRFNVPTLEGRELEHVEAAMRSHGAQALVDELDRDPRRLLDGLREHLGLASGRAHLPREVEGPPDQHALYLLFAAKLDDERHEPLEICAVE